MDRLEQGPEGRFSETELRPWPLNNIPQQTQPTLMQRGMHHTPRIEDGSGEPKTYKHERQRYLLETFASSIDGINVKRAEAFISAQGLRLAPYLLLNETDTRRARQMGEIDGTMAAYKPSYDLVIITRHPELESINGPELTESILVHELSHCTGVYHERLIEEARAERNRGKYVQQILGRPCGFAEELSNGGFILDGAAAVAAKYTIRRTDGVPDVVTEAFVAQAFDLLCQVDPGLDYDLTLGPTTAEGSLRVARRLNRIQPGLYTYLRDIPFGRENYRECLIYIQGLVSYLTHQKTGIVAGSLIGG